MLLFGSDHGVPRNTVGEGVEQRSRRVLDSDQRTRFQVIYVPGKLRENRISSNCSSQSYLWGAISFSTRILLQLFVKTIRVQISLEVPCVFFLCRTHGIRLLKAEVACYELS